MDIEKLKSHIESILYLASKPMSLKKLSNILKADIKEVEEALTELIDDYKKKGICIARNIDKYQFVTNPENAEITETYIKEDVSGELTKPSLETLTIIAYRGPITKEEIELIRGVNCSLILRNLLMRGLVESRENKSTKNSEYNVTFDFMRFLGITDVRELPDFEKLNSNELLNKLFETQQ